jgi:predicted nucleic acid-binding protein
MQKKVYLDTSSLILLFKINQLNVILLLYRNVYITEEIRLEYIKIKPLLDKINLTDFRLSSDIQAKALLLAGE